MSSCIEVFLLATFWLVCLEEQWDYHLHLFDICILS